MSGLGLIFAGLGGAGTSLAQSIDDEQKAARVEAASVANDERSFNQQSKLSQMRHDLQMQAQQRADEAKSAPMKRAGEFVKGSTGTTQKPAEGELYEDNGYKVGMSVDEMRKQVMAIEDPAVRADALKTLDEQVARTSQMDIAPERKRTKEESLELAAMRALEAGDMEAAAAIEKYSGVEKTGQRFSNVAPGTAVWDHKKGQPVYQNTSDADRNSERLESNERIADKKIEAINAAAQARATAAAMKNTVDPASVEEFASSIASYGMSPLKSRERATPFGQAVLKRVKELNPEWNEIRYGQMDKAVKAFGTGKEGATVRSLNVAVDHIDTALSLVAPLNNVDAKTYNSLKNKMASWAGDVDVTNFEAVKHIVADEIVKSVVGGQSALADREEMANKASLANSPEQLRGVYTQFQRLMRGQLDGLKQQYERNTGYTDFEENFLSPAARKLAHGGMVGDHAPTVAPSAQPKAAPAKPTVTGLPDDVNSLLNKYGK